MRKQINCITLHRFFSKKYLPSYAQMAESVDALVSNTSGAIRAGSIPALGTKTLGFKTAKVL